MIQEGERPLYVCTGCGDCCRWTGYVRIKDEEANRIAAFLGLSVYDFIEEYTDVTADRRGLTIGSREDGACRFLTEDNRCHIQQVKPQQCIDFPHRWRFPGFEELCPAIKLKLRVRALRGGKTGEGASP